MNEIPSSVEAFLRSNGLDDRDIAELRRSGHVERRSTTGDQAVTVKIADVDTGPDHIYVNSMRVETSGSAPADALELLRGFGGLIPASQLAQLEQAATVPASQSPAPTSSSVPWWTPIVVVTIALALLVWLLHTLLA